MADDKSTYSTAEPLTAQNFQEAISLKLELGPSLPFPMTWEACDQLVSEMLTAPPGAAPGERLNGYGEPVAPPDLAPQVGIPPAVQMRGKGPTDG